MWLGAVMAALGPCALFAQTTGPSPASDPLSILSNPDPSISQDWRELAAIRLVASRNPADVPRIVDFLNNGPPPARLAVAKALGSVGWPRPEFVDSLSTILLGRDSASVAAAAQALTHYPDNPGIVDELIGQAKSDRPADVRIPVVRALGFIVQKQSAQTLVDLLQRDEDEGIRAAAGDALIDMTGLRSLDHNAQKWAQWYTIIANLSDADASAAIMHTHGEAYQTELNRNKELQNAAAELLENDYWQASVADRTGILMSYLHSAAPEIRDLGAQLVFLSASANGAPPGTLQETRSLLTDPSAEVRGAAAKALSYDVNSAADLAAQLSRETDDLVRVQIIQSVAQFQDPRAVAEMLKLLGSDQSLSVRVAAADGIAESGPVFSRDAALKARAIDLLKSALADTDVPGSPGLRQAIVGALAAMRDNSLSGLFLQLVGPTESQEVREKALRGLGNLPDPTPGDSEIPKNFDDAVPNTRLAAVQAIGLRATPPSWLIMGDVLRLSNEDASPSVRAEAWNDIQAWVQSPDIDEADLPVLADGLKTAHELDRELVVREKLRDRLMQDAQNAPAGPQRLKIEQDVALQQQNIGDLLMDPSINDPSNAAGQYQAAFAFWKANNGAPGVINTLSGDITRSLLGGKRWDDAAKFASGVIKEFGSNPQLEFMSQTVATEFVIAAQKLADSNDPSANSDATALFAAVNQMNPPLPSDILDQLNSRQAVIRQKHAAPAPSSPQ
jgi:HEAT repeat protein